MSWPQAICGQALTSKPLLAVAQISPQAVSRCSDYHVVERWKRCYGRQDQILKALFQVLAGHVEWITATHERMANRSWLARSASRRATPVDAAATSCESRTTSVDQHSKRC